MTVQQYLDNINKRYKLGNATEHTFRGDLQQLIESLVSGIAATNEPKRQACGAPDYILTKKDIPVGYIEAKDIDDDDLDGTKKNGNKPQFDRYKASLNNLIFTDYLDFHLFVDSEFKTSIRIAETKNGQIVPLPENFLAFENLIKNFCTHVSQTIKSSKKLAEMMAGKARILADVIDRSLTSDENNKEDSTLKEQMQAFKQILIHDIKPKKFADIYAQTIAYGMFAARVHDSTLPTFSRQEAAELIPKSNPFLRKLFGYIAGPDIDDRIKWIVDSLAEIFLACNVKEILKDYGKSTKMEDPIIHFYETFLTAYDKKTKIQLGVWYTPQPVVDFIVRSVDNILKAEFNLSKGLADNSKTTIKVNLQATDKRYKDNIKTVEEEVHKVQILDPATGTGTFLAEVVKQVYKKFKTQKGIWSNYVEKDLIPRLNGFELLMASYAMAHLQLDLLLTETGYIPTKDQRLRIYLTDSLEESHPDTGTLFASWLSNEANEANFIKRDTPVMCILGNPPYLGESKNKGKWILKLMEDYKKEPGGKIKLKEKNSKWLNADEYKFIRYGQYYIEKNGTGVLAFINPHSFLDNPTFRGMRWNLLKTYDEIYVLDLHGNNIKKEISPDGSTDENVFDIEQGVSINIFIKTGLKKENQLGKIYHFDLYGKRELKYDYLTNNDIKTVPYKEVKSVAPHYFFAPKEFKAQKKYDSGFSLPDLFPENSLGVLSKNDDVSIDFSKETLKARINNFISLPENEVKALYNIKNDSRDWVLSRAISDLKENYKEENYKQITYRPFDTRWTFFTGKPKGFFAYSQNRIMRNMKGGDNLAIISGRQGQAVGSMQWNLVFITNTISEQNIYYRGGGTVFPLYLYPENTGQQSMYKTLDRTPNLNSAIVKQLSEVLGIPFVNEKEKNEKSFAPVDILDYIYAILHSQNYREKYKEFLKINFPQIPFPQDLATFWSLVKLGKEIRQLHLLLSPKLEDYITEYPVEGNNIVGKIKYENLKVYINEAQYFENVPQNIWEFYIGGFQPAQKWLKDRKDITLDLNDILHYQKIIVVLKETINTMDKIDNVFK